MENKRYKEIKIFKSNVLVKRVFFFLLNASFAMAVLGFIIIIIITNGIHRP